MSTIPTTVTVNVTDLDPEDYYNRTGEAALAVELAEKHGGTHIGGGTDFTTGRSDIDFEVCRANVADLTAALTVAGLVFQVFGEEQA